MKSCLFFVLLSLVGGAHASETKNPAIFRYHLPTEPASLDPQKQKSSASNYLLNNLHRNLFRYDNAQGLVPELAQSCQRQKNTLTCQLKKNLKWSDGSPLTSADFLRSYLRLLDPKTRAPRPDLLFKIKNALAVYQGKKKNNLLGVTAPNPQTLKFEFSEEDPDFEYKLTSLVLAPVKTDITIGSGPYRLKKWLKGRKIQLEPNPFYLQGHPQRPPVEVFFIEEDSVALQLYEKDQLQLLRRLPTLFIPKAKERPDFYWVPLIRLDYLGFGPELKDHADIRKALTYSLNYPELQKIFSSEGVPGCLGLPDSWFPSKAPCYDFDLKKVPHLRTPRSYTLMFSNLGGEDHKRATEWLQNQWKKNAGLNIHLEMKENKFFLSLLKQKTPALFRKGVAVDRPTCLAALETFAPDSPENFIDFKDQTFQKLLHKLAQSKDQNETKKNCLAAAQHLMSQNLLIPLGPIQFAILAKERFLGWKINQMNQLDLSQLHSSP